jgi:glyoxalase/bleomycin resistance protein/dioxygenase superfamily protein
MGRHGQYRRCAPFRLDELGPPAPRPAQVFAVGANYRSHADEGGLATPEWPMVFGHVASFTPGLDALEKFYRELLGFKWSDTLGDFFVFLRCGADHHAANFMASTKFEGMHHIAYECRDPSHVITLVDHLAKNGYRLDWGPAGTARATTCSRITRTPTAT